MSARSEDSSESYSADCLLSNEIPNVILISCLNNLGWEIGIDCEKYMHETVSSAEQSAEGGSHQQLPATPRQG